MGRFGGPQLAGSVTVRAVSSVVEHRLYTPAVTGSNPVPPNLKILRILGFEDLKDLKGLYSTDLRSSKVFGSLDPKVPRSIDT